MTHRSGSRPAPAATRGTPQPVIERMNAELQAALQANDVMERLTPTGIEPAARSIDDFIAFVTSERRRLGDLATRGRMGEVQ